MEHPALSNRIKYLSISSLYEFFRKVKEMIMDGHQIINLGLGEPENNTPWRIKLAGILAIIFNRTKYVPSNGSYDLRQKIAHKYEVMPTEIVLSHSAKLMNWVLFALTNPGDSVLIPTPYFPPFVEVVKGLECEPVLIKTAKNNFQLTSIMVINTYQECYIKPKVLIINSPNNPTGVRYDENELKKIAIFAKAMNIFIISDECYSSFSPTPDFTFRKVMPEAIIVGSASKMYAMTGWRLGWGVMPTWLAKKVELALDHFLGPPSSITERALIKALDGKVINDFKKQRQIITSWLDKMLIPYGQSDSAFYKFCDISAYTKKINGNSNNLAELLLKHGVAVTPGNAFGDYNHHVRIAYCVSVKKLKKALYLIENVLNRL